MTTLNGVVHRKARSGRNNIMLFRKYIWVLSIAVCTSCMHRVNVLAESRCESAWIPDPTWPCGMANGIPCPADGSFLFEATLRLGRICEVGETPYGSRTVFVVGSGDVTGPRLRASVLSGGLDFQLLLSNDVVEVEQLLVVRTSDGYVLYLQNVGVGFSENDVRLVLDVEAPNDSPYAWLNEGYYVAERTVDVESGAMKIAVYDVSDMKPTGFVNVLKPGDHLPQPYDVKTPESTSALGRQIVSERVALGDTVSVGAGKRGERHIIPITGGEVTGKVSGTVLAAGADYQLLSDTFTLDARYLWESDDGEFIIIRNAGSIDSLVPVFEARIEGPYAWLNSGAYRSGVPQPGNGAVSLILYQSE